MIRIRRDPLGFPLFDVRYPNAIHTFLSFAEAQSFQRTDGQEYQRESAIAKDIENNLGKGMKTQRIKWTEQRGTSGN